MRLFLLLFLVIALSVFYWYSIRVTTTVEVKSTAVTRVVVYKSKRQMDLMNEDKIVRTYKIALGGNPVGHKIQEGDNRTPEGKYKLDWRNNKSSCYKSIHISYPQEPDRKNAKQLGVSPGGDIMIHGLHPSIKILGSKHIISDWTNGCIAVSNQEMDEIWKLVKNGTPIEIRK